MGKQVNDRELEQRYCEFLDDAFGVIKICGFEYDASNVLKHVDPTAFRCGLADWIDSEITEGRLVEREGEYFEGNENE